MSDYQRNTVVASETETTLTTIADPNDPGKAMRISVEPGVDGYVRLEQLAFSPDMGWYTQKSFRVPGDMIEAMVPALRQASAVIPKADPEPDQPLRFPASIATAPKSVRQASGRRQA